MTTMQTAFIGKISYGKILIAERITNQIKTINKQIELCYSSGQYSKASYLESKKRELQCY
jgi:hypothetical protein